MSMQWPLVGATPNPIEEWLARALLECGDPETMLIESERCAFPNTKKLLRDFAEEWQKKRGLAKRA
jgi:hypothetical protein